MAKVDTKQKHVYRKLGELKPYGNNARLHDEDQLKKIVDSIGAFGFTAPIIIDEKDMILAGHGRHAAAGIAGLDEVPCVIIPGLTRDEKSAYVIADNQLTLLGDWDLDMLASELNALDDSGFDIELTGLDLDDLAEMEKVLAGGDDEKPEREPPETPENIFTLVFDDQRQELKFLGFMRWLDKTQPGETHGQKIKSFIETLKMDEE